MKQGIVGGVVGAMVVVALFSLFGFTTTIAPSRHFSPTALLGPSLLSVVTSAGDPGNTGIPTPGFQQILGSGMIPSAAWSDGGITIPYIEFGSDVLSGGTKTVTFKNTFSGAVPVCFCTDGTALTACDAPIATITAGQVVFNGTGTDKFSWVCIGGWT